MLDGEATAPTPPAASAGVTLLVAVDGDTRRVELPIDRPLRLGRGAGCDVVIDHRSVSRHHAELGFAPLAVRDLGSANGVLVRGQRVAGAGPHPLAIGDALVLGDAVVVVCAVGPNRPSAGGAIVPQLTRALADGGAPWVGYAESVAPLAVAGAQFEAAGPPGAALYLAAAPGPVELAVRAAGGRAGWAQAPLDGTRAEALIATAIRRARGLPEDPNRAVIAQVAPSTLPVLILGDTGTGKELCAEKLHRASPRAGRPLVRVNCAALVATLVESELFGHERGAFTGAIAARPGLFEQADGGTLFLDEIGELPLALQPKLLRVLEDGVVQRIGGAAARPVDVRLLAATNRRLDDEVAAGRFRADLFYRLSGVTLNLPALRGRAELVALADAMLVRAAAVAQRPVPRWSDAARAALVAHPWPGNLRELRIAVERAVLLSPGPVIEAAALGLAPASGDGRSEARDRSPEAEAIVGALEQCGGNQTRAARLLGISRNTLQARMERHRIPRPRG
jgi:two-component system response regulator AtoC